tara:strand:+ start:470 stop:784 length:315 start_codon:yes stop_codon:yes gene_type:complete
MPKENSPTDQTRNKPYTFVQKEEDDFSCIKITEGKYKDIIFHYGKVGFGKDENPDGTKSMKFDYTVKRNPNDLDLLDNKEFIDYIGDLLLELLDEKLKSGGKIE